MVKAEKERKRIVANIIEKTRYQEAYRCEDGHFILKYRCYGNFPAMDSMTFYSCCPECGSKNISIVTGIWEREYEIISFLWIKRKKLVKEKFVESILSFYDRERKK